MRIHLVVGTRPNIIKIAKLYHVLKSRGHTPEIIHTGQHYSDEMDKCFFKDFNLPPPVVNFGVNNLSPTVQVNLIIQEYSHYLNDNRPDLIVSIGDCNAAPASAFVGKLNHIPVAHLEAGLRSNNLEMPEENNRIVTDSLSDRLWTHSPESELNIASEGISIHKVKCVGNIMCDTIEMMRDKINYYGKRLEEYALVTIHRPSNVDDHKRLCNILEKVDSISQKIKVVFPVHPRTDVSGYQFSANVIISEPVEYARNLSLIKNADVVITDSGGIQEETSYFGIPCLTLRDDTERPITIEKGTNKLTTIDTLESDVDIILQGEETYSRGIPLWDGQTSERIVDDIEEWLCV